MSFRESQLRRIQRARKMGLVAALKRIREHLYYSLSPTLNLRRLVHILDRLSVQMFPDVYVERPETGPRNLDEKLARVAAGGPFEPLDVALVNRAAVQLIGNATRILELGSGTGLFAWLAAADRHRVIVASESDPMTRDWAEANRSSPNIAYEQLRLEDVERDSFDLVVAIELIEHIWDFAYFLKNVAKVAPAAIITTPNKNASALGSVAATPAYGDHVREWTAGEYYWVLRAYYDNVRLYTLPDFRNQITASQKRNDYIPKVVRCSVLCREPALLAYCEKPRR